MELKPLPRDKQEAFVSSPLYARFSTADWSDDDLTKFLFGSGTVDAWCVKCERDSVFRIASQLPGYNETPKKLPYAGVVEIQASCTRGAEDSYSGCRAPLVVMLYKEHTQIRKIGQFPSAADLAFGSLDDAFNKELDSEHRRELGTAIGLYAHGVGIGSFVYLRRIFETLLEEAHKQAASEPGWDESTYAKSRVSERILLLRAQLPGRLVAASNLYGVLSTGVHELSEQDCLANFDLVKSAIELILKDRHEDKRYDAVIKAIEQAKSNHS